MISLMSVTPITEAVRSLSEMTKNLAFQSISKEKSDRKLVVSTMFLNIMGWFPEERLRETLIGKGRGIRITRAPIGISAKKKVYKRTYKNRPNYVEPLLDIRSKSLIEDGFLGAARAHISIKKDSIDIVPIFRSESWSTKGAKITIPTISPADIIIDVLQTLKAGQITHANIEAYDAFWQSDQAKLLIMQLRRMGYSINLDGAELIASVNTSKAPHYRPVELIPVKPIDLPVKVPKEPLTAFVAMSAGFDASLLVQDDFKVVAGLEWAPPEKRIKRDMTEAYATSLAVNSDLQYLYNEDIYECVEDHIAARTFGVDHSHFSIVCKDFSLLKGSAARDRAYEEGTWTRDMFINVLSLIQKQCPRTISIENVPPFSKSVEHEIMISVLEKMGYQTHSSVLYAPDFGGLTGRRRSYIYAGLKGHTKQFIEPVANASLRQTPVIRELLFDEENMLKRNVSHTKTVAAGISSGRIRLIDENTLVAPTVGRFQAQCTKDSVRILLNGQFYMPTLAQLRKLAGVPVHFDASFLNQETQVQIIGQGVDAKLHQAWIGSIKDSIVA